MQKRELITGAAILVACAGLVAFGLSELNRMPATEYPQIEVDFELEGADGTVTEKVLDGKVGLLFFGYTHCPDVCPTTLVNFGAALDMLSEEERKKTRALFVSVDAARDTPELVDGYAEYFHPAIRGVTGSQAQIAEAAQNFLVAHQKEVEGKDGNPNYIVNHSTYIFVVRPDGKIGDLISHAASPEKIVETARHWLEWAE